MPRPSAQQFLGAGWTRTRRPVKANFRSGSIPSSPLHLVILNGATIRGFEIRTFATDYPDLEERDLRELHEMFATGLVRRYVRARFPLAVTVQALRFVADRRALGKVIIDLSHLTMDVVSGREQADT